MQQKNNILIVTGDCPSHPYACYKLATVLARNHHVTLAGPNGSALDRLQAEAKTYNQTSIRKIKCVSIGDVTTVVHCNVRPVIDPQEYSSLQILGNALLDRNYNPFGVAAVFEHVMDDQIPTYNNIKEILPDYDLVYAIHSAAATVCDAAEALKQEGEPYVPPCIVFSSLPYDTVFFRNSEAEDAPSSLWRTTRSLVAFPHVATFGEDKSILSFLFQLFWMWLDSLFAEKAWLVAGKRNDERRKTRGLPPVQSGNKYYWQNYPVLSMGGLGPFITKGTEIADNVTVIGSLKSNAPVDISRLDDWMSRSGASDNIIYVCFGTGTMLQSDEVTNLAKMVLALEGKYRILFALRQDEQERYQHILDNVFGTKPTLQSDGVVEYKNGKFRIDSDVPQESLLQSGKVKLFISHMGFGGYTEAINGGVPIVAYPSGCDQWYNAKRAVEAGVAVPAYPKMKGLAATVMDVLEDDSFKARAEQLASEAKLFPTDEIIIEHAKEILLTCDSETESSCSTCDNPDPFSW